MTVNLNKLIVVPKGTWVRPLLEGKYTSSMTDLTDPTFILITHKECIFTRFDITPQLRNTNLIRTDHDRKYIRIELPKNTKYPMPNTNPGIITVAFMDVDLDDLKIKD